MRKIIRYVKMIIISATIVTSLHIDNVFAIASCEAPESMLMNGSFEEGSYLATALPDHWQWDAHVKNAVPYWAQGEAKTGDKSVQISATSPDDARWIQTATVEPNQLYFLSGWIKSENVQHTSQLEDAGANLSFYGTWHKRQRLLGFLLSRTYLH